MTGSSFFKDWKAFTASGSFLLFTTDSRFFRASLREGAMPSAGKEEGDRVQVAAPHASMWKSTGFENTSYAE